MVIASKIDDLEKTSKARKVLLAFSTLFRGSEYLWASIVMVEVGEGS
jgi:hypothetical protein